MFANSDLIELNDDAFTFNKHNRLNHLEFKGRYGYIMIYAPWCIHCQTNEEFWSYLGYQFNKNPDFADQQFRIGIINSEDPKAKKIIQLLEVSGFPRIMHVLSDGTLVDYKGYDLSPQSLIREVCDLSKDNTLCNFNANFLDFAARDP